MAVVDMELARSSDPGAEEMITNDMRAACIASSDQSFLDPSLGAIANLRPASVTYGSPQFSSGGSTALQILADLGKLIESLIARGSTLQFAVWILHPITAAFLSRLTNANGDASFPNVSVLGGTLLGLPIIVSASLPGHVGSPSTSQITLLDAARVWVAQDPQMELTISRHGTIEMLDNPTNSSLTPTATTMVSMFQANSVALRAIRTINWKISDPGFAAVLTGVAD